MLSPYRVSNLQFTGANQLPYCLHIETHKFTLFGDAFRQFREHLQYICIKKYKLRTSLLSNHRDQNQPLLFPNPILKKLSNMYLICTIMRLDSLFHVDPL